MRLVASLLALCIALLLPDKVQASSLEIDIHSISKDGIGESIGTVLASDSQNGLVITPSLTSLSEGEHGFHLHAGTSCQAAFNDEKVSIAGLAAEGHWDPGRPCMETRQQQIHCTFNRGEQWRSITAIKSQQQNVT